MKLRSVLDKISVPGHGVVAAKILRFEDIQRTIGYGIEIIHEERYKQADIHDPKLDDFYVEQELILFARYWLTRPNEVSQREHIQNELEESYGFSEQAFGYDRHSDVERAAIGGALASAEIDRLLRKQGHE